MGRGRYEVVCVSGLYVCGRGSSGENQRCRVVCRKERRMTEVARARACVCDFRSPWPWINVFGTGQVEVISNDNCHFP